MRINIEEKLNSDLSDEYLEALEEFQYITLVESYIADDAEAYSSIDAYLRLLEEIRELTGLAMENISGEVLADSFVFEFHLNENRLSFSIPKATGDWIDYSFANALNAVLRAEGIEKGLYFVYVAGEQFATQIYHLVYLDEATYAELAANPAGFVWNDEE